MERLWLLPWLGLVAAIPCEDARMRCAFRTGCGNALNKYMIGCSELSRRPNICPEVCANALIALMSTNEGKQLTIVILSYFLLQRRSYPLYSIIPSIFCLSINLPVYLSTIHCLFFQDRSFFWISGADDFRYLQKGNFIQNMRIVISILKFLWRLKLKSLEKKGKQIRRCQVVTSVRIGALFALRFEPLLASGMSL